MVWLNAPGLSTLNKLSQPPRNQLGFQVGNLTDATLLRSTFMNGQQSLTSRGLGLLHPEFPTNQLVRQALLLFPQFTTISSSCAGTVGSMGCKSLRPSASTIYSTVNANYMYSKNLASQTPSIRLTGSWEKGSFRFGSAAPVPALRDLYGSLAEDWGIREQDCLQHRKWLANWGVSAISERTDPLAPPASPTTNPVSYWLGYGPGPAQMVPGQSLLATTWTDNKWRRAQHADQPQLPLFQSADHSRAQS